MTPTLALSLASATLAPSLPLSSEPSSLEWSRRCEDSTYTADAAPD
eukprot:CAMPEP_0175977640 /NCGR_PEP_ID=MMETSP0108-20121206/45191_1 /TAXON_ID=195067 ORGANISM="Goniomonas pacifica, Strain CCMP1869" /NCGR_SAMPLE_ID=MMETSP0108 /ASSEMBLY_ACC=CAM_ASM_000204 /LENGTH=45 /DNA_ID= /DNA_START= /DNA_END= /DNA_ORIENTATION=